MDISNAIILTGGMACGKSTVSSLLTIEGYRVIDADKIAGQIMVSRKQEVISAFGVEVLDHNGSLNRKKLGDVVFNDSRKREALESILHPSIRDVIVSECSELEKSKNVYFVDLPLFFESSFKYPHRLVVCVYAPKELQLKRVINRDNLSYDDALKRVEAQIDIEIKRERSDLVINNFGSLRELQSNLDNALNVICGTSS